MALRCVLYSDQIEPLTNSIDTRLGSMLPGNPSIAYLPSSPDPDRCWFQSRVSFYERLGASLTYFGLEEEFREERLDSLFSCDAIHLSGGNTFRFLYWLRKRGLIPELIRYAANGGVLVGVSAGAILMTPNVGTSYLCGDVSYAGSEDLTGLGLVDFSFVPHFDGSKQLTAGIELFASQFEGVVYAVPDGSGIVVEGDAVELLGPVYEFAR